MKTLNRSKPYGEAYGHGLAHRYEQDGILFDAAGNECVAADSKPQGKTSDSAPADPMVVQVGGQPVDLAGMDQEQLHALAVSMQIKLHPRTGAEKVRAAIMAANPADAPSGELAAQLEG